MYHPFVHLRDNGMRALGSTPLDVQNVISPFVQLVHTKSMNIAPNSPHEADELVNNVVRLVRLGISGRTIFGQGPAFYLGMGQLETNVRTSLRQHSLEAVARELRTSEHRMMPTVKLNSSTPYLMAARQVIEIDQRGCCIRLTKADIASSHLRETLWRVAQFLGLHPNEIDLLLDYGYVTRRITDIVDQIASIPHLKKWRRVIFGAGSVPQSLSMFETPGEYIRPWHEKETYSLILVESKRIGRPIGYCDYCTRHPLYKHTSEGFLPSPSAKYSTENGLIILKGKKPFRGKGKSNSDQMLEHAFRIRRSGNFPGGFYSPGDSFIERVATGVQKPAHMIGWLRAEINHHICLKARELKGIADVQEEVS